jgi:exopolyphosphatase/guanosine-5'-triphosphate,3'-diphosphate pyrophosphatase
MKIAILDFGTNTFNLLIADNDEKNGLNYLHSSKEPVKLGQGGINNRILTPEAIERAMQAIKNHFETIKKHQAEKTYAFATSAVRDAKNSREFLNRVQREYDLYVNIIPGDREAELIYKGVRQACDFGDQKILIVDIGGGSNECIISDKTKIYWKESYDLGMARLLDKFNPEDPISENTISEIKDYLDMQLESLFTAIKKYNPTTLMGASGSFETFYALLKNRLPTKYQNNDDSPEKEIILEDYRGLHKILLTSTIEERKNMPGMEPVRVEMIVLATIFVTFILEKWNFERMILSEYALKEGVIAEILNI